MTRLNIRQQLFIKNYTDIASPTFGNATQSYIKAGYKTKLPYQDAYNLIEKPHVRDRIREILRPILELDKGGYLIKLEKELEKCNSPSSRVRLLELIGKVTQLYKDSEVTNNTIVFQEAQKKLQSRASRILNT